MMRSGEEWSRRGSELPCTVCARCLRDLVAEYAGIDLRRVGATRGGDSGKANDTEYLRAGEGGLGVGEETGMRRWGGGGEERLGEKKRLSLRGKSRRRGEAEDWSGERSQFLVGGTRGIGDTDGRSRFLRLFWSCK